LSNLRCVVHRLPLRDANDDRQIANGSAATAQNLRGELGASLDRPTKAIRTLHGALPKELVDQIGVRTMQVEAPSPITLL
jgi:hypothetical protein